MCGAPCARDSVKPQRAHACRACQGHLRRIPVRALLWYSFASSPPPLGKRSAVGGVQFDNGKVNIGDQEGAAIYQATEIGTITGFTPLSSSVDCVEFFVEGKAVICPDAGNGDIEIYKYPAGDSPLQITGLVSPTGAAKSNQNRAAPGTSRAEIALALLSPGSNDGRPY
jgi:hypothetical protein